MYLCITEDSLFSSSEPGSGCPSRCCILASSEPVGGGYPLDAISILLYAVQISWECYLIIIMSII